MYRSKYFEQAFSYNLVNDIIWIGDSIDIALACDDGKMWAHRATYVSMEFTRKEYVNVLPVSLVVEIIGIADSIDATFACDDDYVRAQKVIFSAWSSFFRNILYNGICMICNLCSKDILVKLQLLCNY